LRPKRLRNPALWDEKNCRNLLHYAVAGGEGHPEVVEFLLEMGASVHIKTRCQFQNYSLRHKLSKSRIISENKSP